MIRPTTVSIPGCAPAALTLPQPLTPGALAALEQALASLFVTLRRDLQGERADDAGAIEFDSWRAHLLHA